MVLVDTSIWIDHLRKPGTDLPRLLDDQQVLTHAFVIGELACGLLANRPQFLHDLSRLPRVPAATDQEVMELIERLALMGRGVGYLDLHLLASVRLAPDVRLWTRDKQLATLADELSVIH